MTCKHGFPAPMECTWLGEPPRCPHCRIEELEAQLTKAFSILELYGVPQNRAKYVSNGIDVLVSRMDKEKSMLEAQLAECHEERASYEAERQRLIEERDRKVAFEDFNTSNKALADCQDERDALREALQSIADDPVIIHEPRQIKRGVSEILAVARHALAATKENDDDSL